MDDAVRALSQKLAPHLAPNEAAQVSSHNLTALSAAEVAKAQATLERALRRRVRNPMPVAVTLTISENLKGYLLVAEVRNFVEMVNFRPEPSAAPVRSGMSIEKKLLWEQDTPILDVAVMEDEMLVLDTNALTHYVRRQRMDSAPVHVTPRDPRGHLAVAGDSVTVQIPGVVCHGTWKPVSLTCESGGEFTAERNTLASQNYAEAQIGDRYLASESDGRTHVYDSARKPVAAFDDWGSDFALVSNCAGPRIAAVSPNDSNDSVALYDLINNAPVRVSDPAEFPGPITALTPSLAVTHNLVTGQYEAYSLTVDCGR